MAARELFIVLLIGIYVAEIYSACGPCSGGKLSTESKRGKCRCQVDPCTRKTCSSGSTCELKQKIRGGKTVKYLAKCVSSGSGSQPCSCTRGRLPIEKRNGKCGCRASPCKGNSCSAPNKCMAVTKKKGNRVFGYSAKCIHAHCKKHHPVGKCRAIFEKFFFNIATQRCESFVYNGCSASEINMFSSATECTNYCKIKNTG